MIYAQLCLIKKLNTYVEKELIKESTTQLQHLNKRSRDGQAPLWSYLKGSLRRHLTSAFSGVRASYSSVDRICLYITLECTEVNNGI